MHLPAASQIRGSGNTTKCPLITPGEISAKQDVLLCLVHLCVLLLNEYTQITAPVASAVASITRIPYNLVRKQHTKQE